MKRIFIVVALMLFGCNDQNVNFTVLNNPKNVASNHEINEVKINSDADFSGECELYDDFNDEQLSSAWERGGVNYLGPRFRSELPKQTIVLSGPSELEKGGVTQISASIKDYHNLQNYDYVLIRGKVTTNNFEFFMDDRVWSGTVYAAGMKFTEVNSWEEIIINFDEFSANFKGRQLEDYDEFNPNEIYEMGFNYVGKPETPFEIKIEWIKFCKN